MTTKINYLPNSKIVHFKNSNEDFVFNQNFLNNDLVNSEIFNGSFYAHDFMADSAYVENNHFDNDSNFLQDRTTEKLLLNVQKYNYIPKIEKNNKIIKNNDRENRSKTNNLLKSESILHENNLNSSENSSENFEFSSNGFHTSQNFHPTIIDADRFFEHKMTKQANLSSYLDLKPDVYKLPLYNLRNEPISHLNIFKSKFNINSSTNSFEKLAQEREAREIKKLFENQNGGINKTFNSTSFNSFNTKRTRAKKTNAITECTNLDKSKKYKCEHCKLQAKKLAAELFDYKQEKPPYMPSIFNESKSTFSILKPNFEESSSNQIIIQSLIDNSLLTTKSDKPKTPKTIQTIKPKTGRWSPIKVKSARVPKLNDKFKTTERYDLNHLFKQLDRDQDGHLNFEIVKSKYLNGLSYSQSSFFHQLYDILSEMTFFGLKEFRTFVVIFEHFKILFNKNPYDPIWEIFTSSDFNDYKEEIREYIRLIDRVDFERDVHLDDVMRVKQTDLDRLKSSRMNLQDMAKINNLLKQTICGASLEEKIINYILMIPKFIYANSLLNRKSIIKRNQNSILDMKESSNYHNFMGRKAD